jgi:WD40 repeat protein/serine/threonine protein kinase
MPLAGDADIPSSQAPSPSTSRDAETASVSAISASNSAREPLSASLPPAPRANFAAGAMVHQYEIIRPLGAGGMGHVLLARDTRLGRLVALKFLIAPGTEGYAQRFLAEAQTTARLHHENVVVLHEALEHDGQAFMVLEHLKGQTLRQWIEERNARRADTSGAIGDGRPLARPGPITSTLIPPRRAVELMLPVVYALAHAHERGVVHRDLKPANVMLTDDGIIKVLDFGIAKLVEAATDVARGPEALATDVGQPTTQAGVVLGTTTYMAPEQWGLGEVDHRADLWAVGIMLHELLFGESPLVPLLREAPGVEGLATLLDFETPLLDLATTRPDLGKLGAIIDRCLVKRREDRIGSAAELRDALTSILPTRPRSALDEEPCPFTGLFAFQEHDAERFFGRDRVVNQVTSRLASQPLIAVVGPSGAGKSSFVRAGIIPALKQSGHAWEAFVLRPGPRPLAALAELLMQHAWQSSTHADLPQEIPAPAAHAPHAVERDVLADRLRDEPGHLGAQLRSRARRRRERALLFVDQLEEVYTLASAAERGAFFAALSGVADDATSPLRVVVSVRSDFLDRLAEDYARLPELTRGILLLPPLDRAELREALARPVAALDYRFEPPELVETMLDAVAETRGALPLLQFTAARLWELRDPTRRALTEDSYRSIGGVAGTLARHADAVLSAMTPADKLLARALLLRLVTPERTRDLVPLRELLEFDPGRETTARVLDRLVAARLLTTEGSGEDDGVVEIVHESLVAHWPTLTAWLDESHEDAEFLARLRPAAREWRARGERAGMLWRGEAAEDARRFYARRPRGLAPVEERFVQAVLAADAGARRLWRRTVSAVITVALVGAASMAWLAAREARASRAAQEQAQRAEDARARALQETARAQEAAGRARDATRLASAESYLATDTTTAFVLLREIEQSPPPHGTEDLLRKAILGGVARYVRPPSPSIAWMRPVLRVSRQSEGGSLLVWPEVDGAPTVIRPVAEAIRSAVPSPDGKRLLLVSSQGQVLYVVDREGHDAPIALDLGGKRVNSDPWCSTTLWSADSRKVAANTEDGNVLLVDLTTNAKKTIQIGLHAHFWGLAFSADGRLIATSREDGIVRLWDVTSARPSAALRGSAPHIASLTFSPDGRRLAATAFGHDVHLWDVEGRAEPIVWRSPPMRAVAWAPDGKSIVTVAEDHASRVWSADAPLAPEVMRDHEERVYDVAFSPDGRRLAASDYDGTARIWDVDSPRAPVVLRSLTSGDNMASVAFCADGRHIATVASDASIHLLDLDSPRASIVLRKRADLVWGLACSPDGRRVASGGDDGTVDVWDLDSPDVPRVLRGHEGRVSAVTWSPDGHHLASASADQTARIWDLDRGGEPLVLRGHEAMVRGVAYRPDGERLVTASADKTIRVWELPSGRMLVVLRGHEAMVRSVAYSPDGRRIASSSWDRTARIWDTEGSGEPVVLRGHEDLLNGLAWSPDGRRLATASDDKTVRIWSDLTPLVPRRAELWKMTNLCLSPALRQSILGMSEEEAARDQALCERKVEEAAAPHEQIVP